MLGLDDAARIFAELEAFAAAEPERFSHNHGQVNDPYFLEPGRRYTIDPYFHELDMRFYGSPSESIADALGTWIEKRPSWLRVLPDADYNGPVPGWKMPDHPLRDARRAAFWRRNGPRWLAFFAKLRDYLNHARRPN